MEISNLRLTKDLKYKALYNALEYVQVSENVYYKDYFSNNSKVRSDIDLEKNTLSFRVENNLIYDIIKLDCDKNFVVLECLDKLFKMGYNHNEIVIDLDNEFDIYLKGIYIRCIAYDDTYTDELDNSKNKFISITYKSKLVSGMIERKSTIKEKNIFFTHGFFENNDKQEVYKFYNIESIKYKDFTVDGTNFVKYEGTGKIIKLPDSITTINATAFWDNQYIEEVVCSDNLISIGGDSFYNCKNLKRFVIGKNVETMGNNPFAGCKNLELVNESPNFNLVDGLLYNKDFTRIIYASISSNIKRIELKETTKIIGKHAFYLCDNIEFINVPKSVVLFENNPFSGCSKLKLNIETQKYHIVDDVIYNEYYTEVIGALNSIKNDCLILKDVKQINRNSFWNCKGIKKIVFPQSLEVIGYNPFVGCEQIEFITNDNFVVENNMLLTKDKSKLICCPRKYGIGEVVLPDYITELERGAFSGCKELTKINLLNISAIPKNCFSNCISLTTMYCSDLIVYIGEWSFSHCTNLKEININEHTYLDNFVFSGSNTKVIYRNELSNLLIESENLYALKAMQKKFLNKIDSIIIDPPYNSHIDGIGYKDGNYSEGYINFMNDRLLLSKKLLSKNGFLIINIDEGEIDSLEKLSKNIFGKKFVSIHKWKKLHPHFDTNKIKKKNKEITYEYIIVCRNSESSILNNIMHPYLENDVLKEIETPFPKIFDCFGTNSSAKDEIKELFGDRTYFSTPKPTKLIKEFIRATTNKNSIVLDYFAGSGTTAHALIKLNEEDGGNRKFILISNSENNICEHVTKRRLDIINASFHFSTNKLL
ncbi:MAG: leucine-rich repeat protein [bacterium]